MPLQALHKAGYVHRGLKPGTTLRMPLEHSWSLIDIGCATFVGALRNLTACV